MQFDKSNFFERSKHPYYIVAPEFRQTSGGIRALHYLCHALNEIGYEAYITTPQNECTNPHLRTPTLTPEIRTQHKSLGLIPIGVYPEVTIGNPLDLQVVARWILNKPGHLGGESTYDTRELIFYWDNWVITDAISHGEKLQIPIVDRRIFNNNSTQHRMGFCYYANKYFKFSKKLSPILTCSGTNLCHEIKRTPEQIAEIFRSSEILYTYEPTALVLEALACGCRVAYIDTPYLDNFNWEKNPIFKIPEDGIGKTLPPPVNQEEIVNDFKKTETAGWEHIQKFVKITQDNANVCVIDLVSTSEKTLNATDSNPFDYAYRDWLNKRTFIETDTKLLPFIPYSHLTSEPDFHFLIRLSEGNEPLLADTLDSLAQQIHEGWLLDIISSLPSPDVIDEIGNISWHTIKETAEGKKVADFIVEHSPCNWIIELPPGARVDILYLNRLYSEAKAAPEVAAFYVDDDCCDSEGHRHSARFKPCTNPAYLQSVDLAGPLCVSKQCWIATGGASHESSSPWFGQLIRIADKFGWQSIAHVPDILLTYFENFPSNPESCISALTESLKARGIAADVQYLTDDGWDIRYTPATFPAITIAVLSQGQLEFIIRSVNSIIKATQYPDFEILIVTHLVEGDHDYYGWLKFIQECADGPRIRVAFAAKDSSYAALCNQAITTAEHDLVVLLREEVVIVQDLWLDELARPAQLDDVAAVSPLIHLAGKAHLAASGSVLGLMGEFGTPYGGSAALGDAGYLNYLKVTRDVATPPSSCMLLRKSSYLQVGGMDVDALGNNFSEIDLSLKFRKAGMRCLVHPRSGVVFGGETSQYDLGIRLQSLVNKREASRTLRQRWGTQSLRDPFWNPNLSLSTATPIPETEFRAQWQYMPSDKPRILANPLSNGQGDFRISSPLSAVRKAGLAMECSWRQKVEGVARYFTAYEIAQLDPTTVIIQNYIHDSALAALDDWHASGTRPFIVYTLDDLINDLDVTNPFRKHIPPNSRSRFRYALERCDRLVLSTEYLAETYRHFITDIKVVPNRLESELWLPLESKKRTAAKPRIGWAGGSTHQGDLILLKEIIEKTRDEADWIFFGMCPEEIRPLLAEYHDLIPFHEYPAYLASLNLDIAVAPLAQTPFNQGKSNLRLLEYGALGIPVVCTDIDPYQNSPACRVDNKPNDWIAALRERIYDPDAREREGMAMRDWVRHHYILEEHLGEWLHAHLPN